MSHAAVPGSVLLEHPSGSTARITRHGAQVVSWTDRTGRERLYLSRETRFGAGASIRGGIPVVFPQFGNGPLPKHGFVRTREWSLVSHAATSAVLRITDDDATRAIWPQRFLVELQVELSESLTVRLRVRNSGESSFAFSAALHNYFLVDDVTVAAVQGLGGVSYHDKTAPAMAGSTASVADHVQSDDALVIDRETDRVYVGGPRQVSIERATGSSATVVAEDGFDDWVVWNPWRDGAAALSDMPSDDYLRMICVEAARVDAPVVLDPGMEWIGTETMTVT